jgi:hypothetical protein
MAVLSPWGGSHGVSRHGGDRARAGLAGPHVRGELGADAAGIGVIDLLENRVSSGASAGRASARSSAGRA